MAQPALLSNADSVARRTTDLLDRIFPAPRGFAVRLWQGSELPAADRPAFRLVLNHAGALRRMFKPPIELSLGEAFILGDFDVEGDIFAMFPWLDAIAARTMSLSEILEIGAGLLLLPASQAARPEGRGPLQLHGALHSRERDLLAVQYHYDVGNDFYALFLDSHLQYSCAYFPTGAEDLEAAQQGKMEYVCRKLRLQPGERLLDIGCGWGGLARYAAARYGVRALGVTLSKNQKIYADQQIARAGLRDQVAVELRDYRDLGNEAFDKVVSVGMFEHVGRSHLPEYFSQVDRLLKPGGLFLNHGISRCAQSQADERGLLPKRIFGRGTFQQRYIFPDGELTPVSEVNEVAEAAGFEVRDVENLREHYALTLRNWVERLAAQREAAVRASDLVTYRTWRLYMSASVYGFESGSINVNQTLLAKKTPAGKSSVPLSRADLYAAKDTRR